MHQFLLERRQHPHPPCGRGNQLEFLGRVHRAPLRHWNVKSTQSGSRRVTQDAHRRPRRRHEQKHGRSNCNGECFRASQRQRFWHQFAHHYMQIGNERESERHRCQVSIEVRMGRRAQKVQKQSGCQGFANPAKRQRAQGNPKLDSRKKVFQRILKAAHGARSGNARRHHLLDARLPDADESELRCHKEGIRQDQHRYGNTLQQQQTVHLACEHSIPRNRRLAPHREHSFRALRMCQERRVPVAASRKNKRFWIWIGIPVVILVLVAAVGLSHLAHGTQIDPNRLAKVTRGDVTRSVVATGTIEPITKVEVKSKASGIVEKLLVDINSRVHKGQELAQLDQEEIRAEVDAQRAQLAAAQANVATYQANIEQDKVNAAAPDLPMYKTTLDRTLEMQKEGVVSQQALDNANRDYLAALNKRDAARAQIGVDTARLKQARAQVLQNQASLQQLEEQLSYTTILAPMDGVILSRDVEIGDAVSSILVLGSTATLIMTEGDTTKVYVKGKVDEADIAHVYLGQPARIKVESFRDRTFQGKVTKIAPLGVAKDNVTTFEVRVSIDNPNGELKANMTANAEILLDEHKGVLTVPENAVTYDNSKNAFVNVPDRGQKDGTRKTQVTVGLSNGSVTEIVSGLKEGDPVVLQQ